ncbi:MAG: biopolymer transporter ExbD [Candidatus Azobacteroides sp.]|nr:biopolymer transporter ExbD [Candidatus Azobacteroides sp.]
MAEIQTNDHNEGGKNKQKKQQLRVDFTPMVDMNMLLITFFMFCTTLLKPQTMNINMPTKDKPVVDSGNDVRASGAVTVILAGNDEIYYYLGMPAEDGSSYEDASFLVQSSYAPDGFRQVLLKKNAGTYEQIQDLKVQLQRGEINDSIFRKMSADIQDKAMKELKIAPTVMIKPTDLSTYKNLVDVLDEMLICNIGAYAVIDMSDGDRYLLYKKTGNNAYLTPQQLAQGSSGVKGKKK